jgi:hypothetical protein
MNAVYALLLAAVAVQLSTFATSIYLHRGLTHRALAIHPLAAFPFRLQLWVATGIVPKEWVAVHRKHHRFADQEGDPHSPVLKGLWKILLGNVFYYARETRNPETLRRYAPDVGNDWLDRHLFRHGLLGLLVGLTVFIVLLGPLWGGPAFAVQMGVYVFLNAVINGAGTRPPTCVEWPWLPPVRACTTTTTPSPPRPASAFVATSLTLPGRSSACSVPCASPGPCTWPRTPRAPDRRPVSRGANPGPIAGLFLQVGRAGG